MANNKDKKQFPLTNKENCIIYLYKIISSCEICMDGFKRYNRQTKELLDQYSGEKYVPFDIYEDMCHKTYDIMSYTLNLLGDAQASSISYFKYRHQIQKRIKKGMLDIPLHDIDAKTEEIMSELNKTRNWLNHVPESILVSEMELVRAGKASLPLDPVQIVHHKIVTYQYFEHLYLSNMDFCQKARKVIQAAKKNYSLLQGKSITYQRIYKDEPLGKERAEIAQMSAKIQGLKEEPLNINL